VTEHYAGTGPYECGYKPVSKKGGTWQHRLKHLYRFPMQRLALAIEAAARVVECGAKPNLKQQGLLITGAAMDRFALLDVSRTTKQLGKHDGKHAAIYLGRKHRSPLSFLLLSTEGETLGLFVIALCDLGYKITLSAPSREQFIVAKQLVRVFGMGQYSTIILSPSKELKLNDRVEIYWPSQERPTYTTEKLDINPANAKKTAERIDAFIISRITEITHNIG
jgi:hypothetical protein